MWDFNLLKRFLGVDPAPLVATNVVTQEPTQYWGMLYKLREKFPSDCESNATCCKDSGINFDRVKFISMVLSTRDQTIDFLKRYFYAGYDQDKKDFKQLLEFECCRSDVVNNPSDKWIYVDGLIEDIVSDQRFKNMNLGNDIVKILLNKDSEIQAQKIERSHSLNAVRLMVKHNVFDTNDIKYILRSISNGFYNREDECKIRNNLLCDILSRPQMEFDVYNAVLKANGKNENFYVMHAQSNGLNQKFADLWKRLQNIKMIPSNLVAQAILDVDDFASENILTIQDVKKHYPNVLIDLCVISKKETAMPNFKYCKDYRNIKDFIEKYATAFSDIDLSESIEKIVSLVDGDKDKADRKVIAFDVFDSIGNKSNLSLSVPTKVRLSEYLLLEKRECLEDSFWKKIIEEVSCELDESCEFLKFTVDDQNLIRKNKASIEKGHIKEAIQDLGIETETPKRKI